MSDPITTVTVENNLVVIDVEAQSPFEVEVSAPGPQGPQGIAGSALVQSVNGLLGAVVLNAADVGALALSGGTLTGPVSLTDTTLSRLSLGSLGIDGSTIVTAANIGTYAPTPDLTTLVTLSPATAARNTIEPSADVVPLTIKGRTAGQSAHLQQWKQANGTLAMIITRDGALQTLDGIAAPYYSNRSNNEAYLQYDSDSTHSLVVINRTSIGKVPFSVRGMASQTGNLQEWQDSSSTALGYVQSNGTLRTVAMETAGGDMTARTTASTKVIVGNAGPSAQSGISFQNGEAGSNLYRQSLGVLATDAGTLQVSNGGITAGQRVIVNNTDASQVVVGRSAANTTGPGLVFGSAQDTNFSRDAAGSLTLGSGSTRSRLIIKGFSGQTDNLQEWQDSAAAVKASISSGGSFVTGGIVSGVEMRATYYEDPGNVAGYLQMNFDSTHAIVALPKSASKIPFAVQGFASQSANLQEWQSSTSTVLASVSSGGHITGGKLYSNAGGGVGSIIGPGLLQLVGDEFSGVAGKITVNTGVASGGAGVLVQPVAASGAAIVPLVVKGASGQTGNLQEWQDSTGNPKFSVGAGGALTYQTNVWHKSSDGQDRLHFADSGTFYVNSPSVQIRGVGGASNGLLDVQGELRVSDAFKPALYVDVATGTANRAIVGYDGVTGNPGPAISFGQNIDVSLSRVAAGLVGLRATGSPSLVAPTMTGAGLMLANVTTAPSTNPVGGGVLYSEAGALKWRGTSGTVTTLANA